MKKNSISNNVIPTICLSQNWENATNFPFEGIHHPVTFSYGDENFVVTGSNTDNVYKYNSSSDSWVQLSPFPGGMRGYAYGGSWEAKALMLGLVQIQLFIS